MEMIFNGNQVRTWWHNGVNVWNCAVDMPITLLKSSASAGDPCYAYNINATIYKNIDLSLFKGVQFYVSDAYVNALHIGGNTSISVVASDGETNVGSVGIASGWVDSAGTRHTSSNKGKVLTIKFTSDEGMADLKVVGATDGTPSSAARWSLSNVFLLARDGTEIWEPQRVIWTDLAFSNSRNEPGSYSITKETVQDLTGFRSLDISVAVSFNGLYRGSNDCVSLFIDDTEYVLLKDEWIQDGLFETTETIDISELTGEHTIKLWVKSNATSDYYYGWFSGTANMKIYLDY